MAVLESRSEEVLPDPRRALSAELAAALSRHWPEYLIEAAALGAFMISACLFTALLEFPGSPVHRALPDPTARRALMGVAMGLTAVAIIFSPWGKRSGAHMNPSLTLTFFRLGKVERADAIFYVAAQFLGGAAGVLLASRIVPEVIGHPRVQYAATMPGPAGPAIAFAAEVAISFVLMAVVLAVSNRAGLSRFTGLFAGALIFLYITFEAPLSGMSMNPARSAASAVWAGRGDSLWIYFVAPLLGMLLAGEARQALKGRVLCAKLHHENDQRCIFRCAYAELRETSRGVRDKE